MNRFVAIAVLWLVAVIISVTSFWIIWNELPGASDLFVGHTVYTLLSLPISFLDAPMNIVDGSAQNIRGVWFLALLFIYWGIMFYLHRYYLTNGSLRALTALAAILLISSVKWLYYSMGMAGI